MLFVLALVEMSGGVNWVEKPSYLSASSVSSWGGALTRFAVPLVDGPVVGDCCTVCVVELWVELLVGLGFWLRDCLSRMLY